MDRFVVTSTLVAKYVIGLNMEPVAATISYFLDTVAQLIKCIGYRKPRHYDKKP